MNNYTRFLLTTSLFLSVAVKATPQWALIGGPANAGLFAADDSIVVATNPMDQNTSISCSMDNGDTWKTMKNPNLQNGIGFLAASNGCAFIGIWNIGMCRLVDNGSTLQIIDDGLPPRTLMFSPDRGFVWIKHIANSMTSIGSDAYVAIQEGGIFRMANNGWKWEDAGIGLPYNTDLIAAQGTKLFAVSNSTREVFRSTNGGQSWKTMGLLPDYPRTFANPAGFFRGAFIANAAGLFVGTNSGFYESTSDGSSWLSLDSCAAISSCAQTSGKIYKLIPAGRCLFASTPSGMYSTSDNGMHWRYTPGSDTVTILGGNSKYVFGATKTGIVRRSITDFTTGVESSNKNNVPIFWLCQNYPNPFNPSTTIRYQLSRSGKVSLKIFNTLGQMVATLTDEYKQPGSYQVEWNAKVPSGTYFYRLQAGEYAEAKKMILLK